MRPSPPPPALSPEGRECISSHRIFFGHQSVGADLLAGIRELAPELILEETKEPAALGGPLLAHMRVGQNGDPASKDAAFLEATASLGEGDIAFYKYCYLDMTPSTDPDDLHANYMGSLRAARERGIHVFAVTMPITSVAPAWKRLLKSALGKTTELEMNARRLRFNQLLRESGFPLLDLARFESTLEDGSRSTRTHDAEEIEILPAVYTDDGSHLNERGRRHVAAQLIRALAAGIDG